MNADALRLRFTLRTRDIPLGDIERVEVKTGRLWGCVRVSRPSGAAVVSGLSRDDAQGLAAALEAARAGWWRKALADRLGTLHSIHARVAHFEAAAVYATRGAFAELRRDAERAAHQLPTAWPDALSDAPEVRMLEEIRRFLAGGESLKERTNRVYMAKELERSRAFFDKVEERPLTDEQRRAVVVDEERNLVVAAAGSGKTSVLVAKAGWLIDKGGRRPSELLLLAFAKNAQQELEERTRRRLRHRVAVRTFHSLGMSILGEATGKRPALARFAEDEARLGDLLREIVDDLLANRKLSGLLRWFQEQFAPYKSPHACENWGEYHHHLQRYGLRSLNGEKVKSHEECEIANFLYLNGVSYKYEAPYEHDTRTRERRQYHPDFYLPEAGIYIEHFGIDAKGNTASFVNREEYHRGMEWKRQLHKKNGTVLIETFSHERAAGRLSDNLKKKLAARGVALQPRPHASTFESLRRGGWLDPFIHLLAKFLNLYKSARLSFQEVARRLPSGSESRRRAEAFLAVFRPICERYEETLSAHRQIDFHDMINKAAEHVEAGRYRSPFGYILVDEFQDISPGRARLLKALLEQSPNARLFAVGDDWQAIYRFAGSDIAIMREFGERFGNSARCDLETTFRCADRIAAVATEFVLRNPAQIRKKVRSTRAAGAPCVHVGLPGAGNLPLLSEALERIAADAAGHPGRSSVLLLGRYRHLRPKHLSGLGRQHPRLALSYQTVHGAKGLQADYVVVLGLCAGKYGFPAEVDDDPLLDLVLSAPEPHPNAEERRLFYVAMTRARRQVFLLADEEPPSSFVRELLEKNYDVAVFGRLPEEDVPCPRCVRGRLVRRERARDKRAFYGCSNSYCDYAQPPCPACGTGLPTRTEEGFRCRDCNEAIEACPACGGWLERKSGRHGPFIGCSTYPACAYTRSVAERRRSGTSGGVARPR